LYEGQSISGAATSFCDSPAVGLPKLEKPEERDRCVVDTAGILASQVGMTHTISAASIGPILVNTTGKGTIGFFDPKDTGGSSKLHIEIHMPLQVGSDDPNSTISEYTLRVPPWVSAESATSNAVQTMKLWKSSDYVLMRNKIRLEQTRKSPPVEDALQVVNQNWQSPAVSFDEFFPSHFVLHWPVIYADWNRVKIAGPFFPPVDGSVCIQFDIFNKSFEVESKIGERITSESVISLTSEKIYATAEHITSCFTETETIKFDFSKISATSRHRMIMYLKNRNNQIVGSRKLAEFHIADKLKPKASSNFLELLRNTVSGWIYLEGSGDNPDDVSPTGHTMIGTIRLDALQVLLEQVDAHCSVRVSVCVYLDVFSS
jgi:hypothetical protein